MRRDAVPKLRPVDPGRRTGAPPRASTLILIATIILGAGAFLALVIVELAAAA